MKKAYRLKVYYKGTGFYFVLSLTTYKPYGLFFGVTCAPSTIGWIMFWLLAQCWYTLPSE